MLLCSTALSTSDEHVRNGKACMALCILSAAREGICALRPQAAEHFYPSMHDGWSSHAATHLALVTLAVKSICMVIAGLSHRERWVRAGFRNVGCIFHQAGQMDVHNAPANNANNQNLFDNFFSEHSECLISRRHSGSGCFD